VEVVPEGAELGEIATGLNQSRSGCHRTLLELIGYGYVRQTQKGEYRLSTKLPSMGLSYLSKSGLVDIAQPLLKRLADSTNELVRLAIVDGTRLTLVAKAQGANSGVLYDPDMGIELRLSCSAAGHAWLMTRTDEEAIEAVSRQGFGDPRHYGPRAPTTIKALLKMLADHRTRGFALLQEVYAPGMSSMAAAVQRRGEEATAAVVIAGQSIRFTRERMTACGPELLDTAGELALVGNASPLLKARNVGTWGNVLAESQ
jgi:IclR family transcriptional regulator, acetate operon repressor